MVVTDDEVAAVRAALRADEAEFERLFALVQQHGRGAGFAGLLVAAFRDAVDRRFRPEGKINDIIQFVATARTRLEEAGEAINPNDAERLIRAALGDGSAAHLTEQGKGAQILLLGELIYEEGLDDRGLDVFLAKARARAEREIR